MATVEETGWASWARFAAVIAIVSGMFSILQGVVGLLAPDTYFVATQGKLFLFDISGWGWWTLVVGILLIIVGVCLYIGAFWARTVGIVIVALSALVQLLLIPAQPWWSMIIIALDLLIIYAISMHGRELR